MKKFCVIGNNNAITYKEVFHYIKSGKLWLGHSSNKTMEFSLSDSYEKFNRIENGKKIGKVPAISWFTNLETGKAEDAPTLINTYNEEDYPKYDNYDAINVNKVNDIPYDYDGVMGVPITIIDKVCSDGLIHFDVPAFKQSDVRYRIVKFRKGDDNKDLAINGYTPYFRILIQKVCSDGLIHFDVPAFKQSDVRYKLVGAMTTTKVDGDNYGYPYINGKKKYARILIQKVQ